MEKHLDRSFDTQFERVEHLLSYPWVGNQYKNNTPKVLLIGASQYATDGNGNPDEDTAQWFREDKDATRGLVFDTINDIDKAARFYQMIFPIFNVSDLDSARADFWTKVAFYNFFQEPDGAVSENPHDEETRINSWKCWQELVDILQPDVCIFLGKDQHSHFDKLFKEGEWGSKWNLEVVSVEGSSKIPAIKAWEKLSSGEKLDIWFIQHPSRISPEPWNKFLNLKVPEAMKWMETK